MQKQVKKILLFILVCLWVSLQAKQAPDKDTTDQLSDRNRKGIVDLFDGGSATPSQQITGKSTEAGDSALKEDIRQYNRFVLQHRENVFKWQLLNARIIFFVVISIVLFGMFLSYIQFRKTYMVKLPRGQRKKAAETPEQNAGAGVTHLEVGKDGIKIQSAVIGLIILIISVAFFYLYLEYAFQIKGEIQMPELK